jgi:hypothetical protein
VADENTENRPAQQAAWTDLLGIDPDYTGDSCSVDYVRWSRGAESLDEFEHEKCWAFLTDGGSRGE